MRHVRKKKTIFCGKLLNVVLYFVFNYTLEKSWKVLVCLYVRDSNIYCKSGYLWLNPLPSRVNSRGSSLEFFCLKGTVFDDIANELNGRMRIDRYV